MEKRLLASLEHLPEETDSFQREIYDDLVLTPVGEDSDASWPAETSFQLAFEYYEGLSRVRQSLLNLFPVLLYHAWEQQLLSFFRQEVLEPEDSNKHGLLKLTVVQERMERIGIELGSLPTWSVLDELRLVANTVKHADGSSAEKLKRLRPELFTAPSASEIVGKLGWKIPPTHAPLSGDDLFVTWPHVRAYGAATVDFWAELSQAWPESVD